MRVPVGVEQDARVRGAEVDAKPARASGQEEDEQLRAAVELVNALLSVLYLRVPVYATVLPTPARRNKKKNRFDWLIDMRPQS